MQHPLLSYPVTKLFISLKRAISRRTKLGQSGLLMYKQSIRFPSICDLVISKVGVLTVASNSIMASVWMYGRVYSLYLDFHGWIVDICHRIEYSLSLIHI